MCRSLGVSSRRTARPEAPGAPPPDCPLGASGLSRKEKSSQLYFLHGSTEALGIRPEVKGLVPAKPLGFSRSLRNSSMAFPSLRTEKGQRREKGSRSTTCLVVGLFFFTVNFGTDLQCVQSLSTPPRLPLHIHYVGLQLHHLLLQLAHLGLDTH